MRHFIYILICGTVIAGLRGPVLVAEERSSSRESRQTLTAVLRSEAEGKVLDRGELLANNLSSSRRDIPAHWQAGQVRTADGWVRYDQFATVDNRQDLRNQYRELRRRNPGTLKGNLELADWCRSHGLRDQERVHLLEALEFEPDSAAIMTRLGFRPVGGTWLSPEQLQILAEERDVRVAALKKWQTRLVGIRNDMISDSSRRQQIAAKRLAAIVEPEAVYAMQEIFFDGIEPLEITVAKTFGKLSSYQAAYALVDIAVESKNSRVRNTAIEELKEKPHLQSVPELLGRLSTPTESTMLVRFRGDRAFIRQVYSRERQYQRASAVRDTRIQGIRGGGVSSKYLSAAAISRFAEDLARDQKEMSRQIREDVEASNGRVFTVLTAISDADVPNTPQAWWGWWNEQQDTEVRYKPLVNDYQQDYQEVTPTGYIQTEECFCAGTPIWTETGFMAIERIRAGDVVLSKNIETGELTYKPVLRRTERKKQDLKTVVLGGGETIVCTAGHPFWRSGHGWTMAKDLEPGHVLHTVTGAHKVEAISSGPSQKAYNLVVDGFHTYFVGQAMILSHDNMIRKPTNAVVPGLMRHELTAR